MKTWKFEIEEMIDKTEDNANQHYHFVKRIGELLENDNYQIDQIIVLNEVLAEDYHDVYLTATKITNVIELKFIYDNNSPQRFSVNIESIDGVTVSNFMGISFFTDVFNDDNSYFDIILLNSIVNLIKIIDDNGIF